MLGFISPLGRAGGSAVRLFRQSVYRYFIQGVQQIQFIQGVRQILFQGAVLQHRRLHGVRRIRARDRIHLVEYRLDIPASTSRSKAQGDQDGPLALKDIFKREKTGLR
jgi:hypothetical protein